jgi:hypothetical protein
MWFLAGLSSGVILGVFLAGLINISAKCDERYIECYSDLERKIENVA